MTSIFPGHHRASRHTATDATVAVRARRRLPTGCRILVVDDNEDAADLLAMMLERLGHTTRVAHDANEALEIVDAFASDLAILDIGLPVMDGYELARRLRERPATSAMKLLALTGYAQASDRDRATAAGFDAHLVKPISIDGIEAIIETLLFPSDPTPSTPPGNDVEID